MNKDLLKKIGLYAGILLLFIGLAYGYTPEVLDGKIVNQGDISQWKGMANEAMTHNAEHPDDPTAWSNAMFGGMPTTATIDSFEGDYTDSIYDFLLTGRRPASYLLLALIGGFLLMLTLGTSTLIAVGGAIAMTFCSYNFQIIEAGHNTKMQAIAYFPWVLAAIIFTYKSALKNSRFLDSQSSLEMTEGRAKINKTWWIKVILGALLFAFALSFQIKANHIQITYYLGIVILAFILGVLIYLCIDKVRRSNMLKSFYIASGALMIAGGIGIATNANKLIPTYEYSKYTMRGGSDLSVGNKDGLTVDYATKYSYGIEEMPNLLIPNYNGGASHTPLEMDSEAGKYFSKLVGEENAEKIVQDMPTYWGPQPPTGGPMYMGAITIFLFVLGLILCKGREKWWLLAATILAVFVAWGHHFMAFTQFCFDYVPMYNKFRAVSMALAVLQITLPMLGFLALDRIMKGSYEKKKLFKAGGIALILTAGFCLLVMLTPDIAGSFTNKTDTGNLTYRLCIMFQMSPQELNSYGIIDDFQNALIKDRSALLVADATRSFVLILIAAALIALPFLTKRFVSEKSRKLITGCVIAVLIFDLWGIGKRYLNEEDFITPAKFTEHYTPDRIDKEILKDKAPNYRVLSIPQYSTAIPSYHHKCIGGYSAVKMQRYDDLLKYYIDKEVETFGQYEAYFVNMVNDGEMSREEFYEAMDEVVGYTLPICSMLNGKHIIGNNGLYKNKYAIGNCWFVNDYAPAHTADEELILIGEVDCYNTAVIGNDFAWARKHFDENPYDGDQFEGDRYDYIELTHYAPNELRYEFSTNRERAVLFSEVYYPKGWKAWIEPEGAYGKVVDGRYQPTSKAKEIDLFRANWILRGAIIPEGEGTLVMRFEPESYRTGENISRFSSILLILMLLGSAGALIWFSRKK